MTSVIYVELSSDSEEEGPPDVKRPRRELTKVSTSKTLPTKLLHIPKASIVTPASGIKVTPTATAVTTATAAGTVVGTYRSMHIPSGITVTKHNNSNGNFNMSTAKVTVENNNNSNNNNNNNNVNYKPFKVASGTWSKTTTGTTMATITSVPSPQTLTTKPAQRSGTVQQNTTIKQKSNPTAAPQKTILHQLQQQQQQQQQKQ
ncbi:uncharacterized protein Dmoj_GI26516, partial [Drosophila mojavensis]